MGTAMVSVQREPVTTSAFNDWRTLMIGLTATMVFLLSAYYDAFNTLAGWFVCVALFTLSCWKRIRNSLGWILLFAGITLYVVPYLSLQTVGYPVQIAWFALFVLFTEVLLRTEGRLSSDAYHLRTTNKGRFAAPIAAIAILAGGVALSNEGEVLGILLFVGWGCSLIPFERAIAASKSRIDKLALLGCYYAVLAVYVLFLWDGFGRIFISSFFLAPLLILFAYRVVTIPSILFAAVAFTLPFIGRVMRFGWGDGIAGIADDSGASHIIVTSEIWASPYVVANAGTLSDQWILFLGNWLPRALWPGKPLGIGLTYVDTYIGRAGYSEGHSTALGIFGEHLYLGHQLWFASTLALLVAVIVLRRFIRKQAAPHIAPVVVFDVCLLTLVWGGMASFGARAWFPLIPMMLIVYFLNRRDHRSVQTPQAFGEASDGQSLGATC